MTELLSTADAIVTTAVIGGFANVVGGFAGPTLVGMLAGKGTDFQFAFSVLACIGALGGVLILCARPHREAAREALVAQYGGRGRRHRCKVLAASKMLRPVCERFQIELIP